VIDKGLGPRAWEDILETSGEYIDIVKLGWGTAYITPNLKRKLEVLREKPVVIGGTFFEAVVAQQKVAEYKEWLRELGLTHVEISDGVIELPRERKLELIADFARDFTVLSEVGSKEAEAVFAPYQWVEWIKEELEAGAWKVAEREERPASTGRPARCAPVSSTRSSTRFLSTRSCSRRRPRPRRPGSSSSSVPG
jgi:phosphosulfolactate synthase